jgi:hypothetical protein
VIPDKGYSYSFFGQAWAEAAPEAGFNDDIARYKRVDVDAFPSWTPP